MKQKFCKECNKEITSGSKSGLCKSCSCLGKRNSNFGKEGFKGDFNPSKRPEVREKISKTIKKLFENKENHPRYKGIEKKLFCKECNKSISRTSYYGNKRCHSCNATYLWEIKKYANRDLTGKNNPMYDVHRFGDTNPNWKNGSSFEDYSTEFNKKLKNHIKNRDNYTCAVCKLNGNLIHHIDYNKKNNNDSNLITLCKKCHPTTNGKREYCKNQFHMIIEARQ